MAFPATDLPDPSTWFSNALITSALMKSNIIDAINLLPRGLIGEANSTSSVTLSTTSDFAGLATVTYTLPSTRRVQITTYATFIPGASAAARYRIQSGYNSGASAVIGSITKVGQPFDVDHSATTTRCSGSGEGTVLLTAGQYTFYAAVTRAVGGQTSDTASNFCVIVEDLGAS